MNGGDRDERQQGGGEDGWQQVRNYKGKRSDNATGMGNAVLGNEKGGSKNPNPHMKILNRMSMSFYITNFPHKITSKEIYNKCREFGMVTDAFISNRLSKVGKRFGFVRFIKVGNADKLLKDLRDAWIGNHKLFADVEKYGRKFHQSGSLEKKGVSVEENKGFPMISTSQTNQNGKTFAEVISSKSGNDSLTSSTCRVVKVHMNDSSPMDVNSYSILVKVKHPEHIPYSRIWLNEEGFADVVVHYVGGRWIHVVFVNEGAKNSFMSNSNLKSRYLALKAPCNSFVPDERMVWVNISGIPKGAWTNEIFQAILGSWGNGVFFGPKWELSSSMGKVCVLTQSKKPIFEELAIELQNTRYDIWIKEFVSWDPKIIRVSYESELSEGYASGEEPEGGSDSLESEESCGQSESFDSELCKGASLESQPEGNQGSNSHVVNEGQDNCDNYNSGPTSLGGNQLPSKTGELNGEKVVEQAGNGFGEDVHDRDQSSLLETEIDPIKENIEVATENDIFSLDRIIAGDNNGSELSSELSSTSRIKQDVGVSGMESESKLNEDGCVKDCLENKLEADVEKERLPLHNNGLDDIDVFLLNRLLAQDKCRVTQDKSAVNDSHLVSSLKYLDSEKRWSYNDPVGNVQGPFSLAQLHMWRDCFPSNFKIWCYNGSVKETIPLQSAFKRHIKDVG